MKKITTTLKDLIEHWASHDFSNTLFLRKLQSQDATKFEVANYLYNAEVIIQNTLLSIEQASLFTAKSNKTLSDFFMEKYNEEKGHDLWARNDYLNLKLNEVEKQHLFLTQGSLDLIAKLHEMARFRPASLLAYFLFGEYHIVLVGEKFNSLLRKNTGINSTLIQNHVVLDKEHIKQDIKILDSLFNENDNQQLTVFDMKECMTFQINLYNNLSISSTPLKSSKFHAQLSAS